MSAHRMVRLFCDGNTRGCAVEFQWPGPGFCNSIVAMRKAAAEADWAYVRHPRWPGPTFDRDYCPAHKPADESPEG